MEVTLEDKDPYLAEYAARMEAGLPAPIDRANAALERADQLASLMAEEAEAASVEAGLAEVARFARLTAAAQAAEAEELALKLAEMAEWKALALDHLAPLAKLEGLPRAEALGHTNNRWNGKGS